MQTDRPNNCKVEVKNTCIKIYDYIRGDIQILERYLQVYDKGRFNYQDVALYYDNENNILYIPSGIQLWLIYKNFDNRSIFFRTKSDSFIRVNQIMLKTRPRDKVQEEALDFCIGGTKYPNNKSLHQLFLNLNTGKGKTYVMVATASYFSIKTAIIMCSLNWMEQWRDRILQYTDTKQDEIYFISGTPSIVKIMRRLVDHKKIKFFLISHDTLRAYGDRYGWEAVHDLFKFLGIGIKVYDEAHLYPTNIFKIDYYTNVWKTYYLTATPMLSDPFRNIAYQRAYARVPKINLFNEETDAHTDYQAILYNSHPSAVDLHNCQGLYGFNIIWYTNYLVGKKVYYDILWILLDMVLETISKEGKILIYIGTNMAIQLTYYWIKYHYRDLSVGKFTTLVNKKDRKTELECKIILSTNKSAGAAMDIKNLEATIDLNDPAKSPVIVRQKLGRTRAWNTTYYDAVDVGFPQLRYYYESKQKIYRKYANNIKPPIILNDSEIRDKLIRMREQEEKALAQLHERENLKTIIEERRPILEFKNPEYNYVQY